MKKEARKLIENKEGYMEQFEGGKEKMMQLHYN